MPHRPSAVKSLRQDKKRRLRNKIVKSRLRTEENKLNRYLERGETEAAARQAQLLTKLLQKAAAKHVLHANKAARKQAQFDRRIQAVRAQPSS